MAQQNMEMDNKSKKEKFAAIVDGQQFPLEFYKNLAWQRRPEDISVSLYVITNKPINSVVAANLKNLGYNLYYEPSHDHITDWLGKNDLSNYEYMIVLDEKRDLKKVTKRGFFTYVINGYRMINV